MLYRTLVAREEADLRLACLQNLAVSNGWQVARVGADGRLLEITEPAGRVLRRFFGKVAAGAALPRPLIDWLGRSRNWGLDRLASRAGEVFNRSRGGMKLTVHFVPDVLATRRGYLLMKEEREALRPEHLASLPLTGREREVLALVAAGKTNAEVGVILDVSARTVQKHLEHIFQKIGVETGTAAAVCALTAGGEAREPAC